MSHDFKILLVDDEPEFLKTLQRFLKRQAFVLVSARDGNEALMEIQRAQKDCLPFDLVITDLLMPSADGGYLIEQIQQHSPRISVIVLSGLEDSPVVRGMLRSDMDLYSPKNIHPQRLLDLIRQLRHNPQESTHE